MNLAIFHRQHVKRFNILLVCAGSLWLVDAATLRADPCQPHFEGPTDLGTVASAEISEASGLAASRLNPDVYWTHNDSGDQNRIYALDGSGRHLATFYINGFAARDWEDIAVGPGPVAGVNYLYVGNIGDNYTQNVYKFIARIPEPVVTPGPAAVTSTLYGAEIITFVFPDGMRDAETVMVDPWTRDLYVASKREDDVRLYRAAYPQSTNSVITLEQAGLLSDISWVCSGDISPSGQEILIKQPSAILHWCRAASQTVAQAMSVEPVEVPYFQEMQGEAVCWRGNGAGYLTISEGANPHLYAYLAVDTSSVTAFQISSLATAENTSSVSVVVKRQGVLSDTATVRYRLQAGTAGGGADYVAATGLVSFAGGASNATVNVGIVNDPLAESSETFMASLFDPVGCTLGTQTQLTMVVRDEDTDHDLLSDDWERHHFGSLVMTAPEDSDQDGTSNATEQDAGTNPTNATSVFELPAATCNNGAMVLHWTSEPGRSYAILKATSVKSSYSVIASNIVATPPQNIFTSSAGYGVCGFYTIRVN